MIFIVLVSISLYGDIGANPQCSPGKTYLDLKNNVCLPCSKCAKNEIIKSTCSKGQDTNCGFIEFFSFNTGKAVKHPSEKTDTKKIDVLSDPQLHSDGEYWKKLAYSLIGVLCGLIVVATFIVLCTCKRIPRLTRARKSREDDDDAYVVIHTIRPPNHQASAEVNHQLLPPYSPSLHDTVPSTSTSTNYNKSARQLRYVRAYRPKRRILNEYVDDVFDSEDSAGSRSSRRLPLQVIPERSSDSEDREAMSEDKDPPPTN